MDKNKWQYITYVFAFCIVLTGLGCFWLGTYFGDDTVYTTTCNCDTDTSNENVSLTIDDVDELGHELYESSIITPDVYNIIYGNDNYDSIDNTDRLLVAMNLISDSAIYEETTDYIKVYKTLYDDAYYKMFGSNKTINYEEFIYNNTMYCNFINSFVECEVYDGGDLMMLNSNFEYDHAEAIDNELYVYVNYIGVYYNDGEAEIYSDMSMSDLIDTITYEIGLDYYTTYESDAGTYKLTYELDTDNNNYYWVSTELV